MAAITLKIKFGSDLRRLTLEHTPSFNAFCQLLRNIFVSEISNTDSLIVKYLDDEDDMITISTDFEVEEAWRFTSTTYPTHPILRLVVDINKNEQTTKTYHTEPVVREICCTASTVETERAIVKFAPPLISIERPLLEIVAWNEQEQPSEDSESYKPCEEKEIEIVVKEPEVVFEDHEQLVVKEVKALFSDAKPAHPVVLDHNTSFSSSPVNCRRVRGQIGCSDGANCPFYIPFSVPQYFTENVTREAITPVSEVDEYEEEIEEDREDSERVTMENVDVDAVDGCKSESDQVFIDALRILTSMGFVDVEVNKRLLAERSGDVRQVVHVLLGL